MLVNFHFILIRFTALACNDTEPAHSKTANDSDGCQSSVTKDTVAFNPVYNSSDASSVSKSTEHTSVKKKPMFFISDVEFSASLRTPDDVSSGGEEAGSTGEITLSVITTAGNSAPEMTLKRELDFSNQNNRTDVSPQPEKTVASTDSVSPPLQVQDNAGILLKTDDITAPVVDKMSSSDAREDLDLKKGSPRKGNM